MNNVNQSGFNAEFNKKRSILFGVILGIISLLLGVLVLIISPKIDSFLILTSSSFVINTIIYVVLAFVFSLRMRASSGGSWSFSVALKSTFVMLLISTLIGTIGTIIYVNYINPTAQEDVLRHTINVTIEFMEQQSAPDEVIDKAVEELDTQMSLIGTISFSQVFRGLSISILFHFLLALVLAAITKSEKRILEHQD